jgi:hypothetical protein
LNRARPGYGTLLTTRKFASPIRMRAATRAMSLS